MIAIEYLAGMIGSDPVFIRKSLMSDKDLWKVHCGGFILTTSGKWDWDSLPSNREDEYYAVMRFSDLEHAKSMVVKAIEEYNNC